MNSIFCAMNYSKQSFHQKLERQLEMNEYKATLIYLIEQIREDHPGLSARKMYFMIKPEGIGRDFFERFCIDNGYGVKKQKNFTKTTNSSGVIRFDNLIAGKELTDVNQVLASDITYYRIQDRFFYLSFIMDLFSRKIKGYSASEGLKTVETTLPALKKVKSSLKGKKIPGCIFHSDGGGQYYNKKFLTLTNEMELQNSMSYSVYENAHAERIIGIIKNEYLAYYKPVDFKDLIKQLQRAVDNYNNRPHQRLKGYTPNQVEEMQQHPAGKMIISDYKALNPFDFGHKDNIDSEPVKGKINGSLTLAIPSPPLTEPESNIVKDVYKIKKINSQNDKNKKCLTLA